MHKLTVGQPTRTLEYFFISRRNCIKLNIRWTTKQPLCTTVFLRGRKQSQRTERVEKKCKSVVVGRKTVQDVRDTYCTLTANVQFLNHITTTTTVIPSNPIFVRIHGMYVCVCILNFVGYARGGENRKHPVSGRRHGAQYRVESSHTRFSSKGWTCVGVVPVVRVLFAFFFNVLGKIWATRWL